ncbi:hypothetical protein PHMEG_00034952 [Phytophthora megakarya]|uniref:Uncharacterized protein n=1 Tax=Phytophthora megakarya TaxID=4795 RepID=A0A225URD4_9STRA|nr:hypothetical protein PHMEG_00034952 [Phytophthora megakarya]
MIFNVDVLNALYFWVSISDIGHIVKYIRTLQRKIPARHPLEPASFIEIAQRIISEDSQAKAHLSLRRYSTTLAILKFQDRSVDSVNSVGASMFI